MAFEKHIIPDSGQPKIAVSIFLALFGEYIRGKITSNQVINGLEEALTNNWNGSGDYSLDDNSLSDINTIISTIDSLSDSASKMIYILAFRDVFDLGENDDVSLYNTQASIKARLGFI